ncbi:MAG: hypothetical protein ACU0DI_07535 [Paracoccaceae bacterium]
MKLLKVLSMRYFGPVIMAFVLVACAPTVPDSAAGVGFEDYSDYELERLAREKELAGTDQIVLGAEISDEIIDAGIPVPTTGGTASSQVIVESLTEQVIVESLTEQASAESLTEQASVEIQTAQTSVDDPTIQTVVDNPTIQVNVDNPTISDEQNFDAVAARETIESDAERLAAQAQAYQVIEPKALPKRRGASEPSIVEFALATTNLVGQAIYSRSIIGAQRRFIRNCAKYPSSDMAQTDFLKLGGPKRDRRGLDPDGDGFACYWDPAPFRQAVQN